MRCSSEGQSCFSDDELSRCTARDRPICSAAAQGASYNMFIIARCRWPWTAQNPPLIGGSSRLESQITTIPDRRQPLVRAEDELLEPAYQCANDHIDIMSSPQQPDVRPCCIRSTWYACLESPSFSPLLTWSFSLSHDRFASNLQNIAFALCGRNLQLNPSREFRLMFEHARLCSAFSCTLFIVSRASGEPTQAKAAVRAVTSPHVFPQQYASIPLHCQQHVFTKWA